jgi:hypothetical protein
MKRGLFGEGALPILSGPFFAYFSKNGVLAPEWNNELPTHSTRAM